MLVAVPKEPARLFATRFRSPQPPLWELREGEWLKVLRTLPHYGRAQRVPACRGRSSPAPTR